MPLCIKPLATKYRMISALVIMKFTLLTNNKKNDMLNLEGSDFLKKDYQIWFKIGLTYTVMITLLYVPIVLLNIFPSNYSFEVFDDKVLINHGVFTKETMEIERTKENEPKIAILLYHIRSIHSLTILAIPLIAFITVGVLYQFVKPFKTTSGIAATKKRAVVLLLMATVILLWLTGEFLHRRGNILSSLSELIH